MTKNKPLYWDETLAIDNLEEKVFRKLNEINRPLKLSEENNLKQFKNDVQIILTVLEKQLSVFHILYLIYFDYRKTNNLLEYRFIENSEKVKDYSSADCYNKLMETVC